MTEKKKKPGRDDEEIQEKLSLDNGFHFPNNSPKRRLQHREFLFAMIVVRSVSGSYFKVYAQTHTRKTSSKKTKLWLQT